MIASMDYISVYGSPLRGEKDPFHMQILLDQAYIMSLSGPLRHRAAR